MNNPIKKGVLKDMNRQLSKEDTQIANKPMKRCSISYVFREHQIKTRLSLYSLLKWPKSKTLKTSNAGEVEDQQELTYIAGGNAKW